MDGVAPLEALPTTLLDLLANPIISDGLLPYLPLQSVFRLLRTSKNYRDFILNTPKFFQYLDLSRCKGAFIRHMGAIDAGGHSWRAERMDENLTEDEFYAGPLRGVLGKLDRMRVLSDVHVLVLDELASVTNDLIHEIITGSKYNIRLLSIRKCPNVNQSKLQQLLTYICRPSRPEGTPLLQGIYVFTDPASDRLNAVKSNEQTAGVTTEDGAALGLLPVDKSKRRRTSLETWYSPSGRVILQGASNRSSWEETMQACKGVLAFDAVLCDSMHHTMAESGCLHEASRDFLAKHKPGIPTMASIALGPEGCSGCGKAPENTPVWGESPPSDFPLLSPPPFSGKLVDAVRPPRRKSSSRKRTPQYQRLIVSCTWCLINRHCDSCHRWWCADCYNPKRTQKLRDLEALTNAGVNYLPSREELDGNGGTTKEDGAKDHDHPRHHHYLPLPPGQPAVTRECWDCGRVCAPCALRSARICKRCRGPYCVWHNDGCDEKTCDWCMYRSGRSTRELY